jgi:NADH:ubiquinone oxidoreductase subunit
MDKLELDEETKRDEWQKDMPKKSGIVVQYRPRGNSAEENPSERSMKEIAEESAAKIK